MTDMQQDSSTLKRTRSSSPTADKRQKTDSEEKAEVETKPSKTQDSDSPSIGEGSVKDESVKQENIVNGSDTDKGDTKDQTTPTPPHTATTTPLIDSTNSAKETTIANQMSECDLKNSATDTTIANHMSKFRAIDHGSLGNIVVGLRKMINNTCMSDVVIHCKDGKVNAHRSILAIRAPVVAELQSFPTIAQATMIDAMQFVYTDELPCDRFAKMGIDEIFVLLRATDVLGLDRLRRYVIRHVADSLSMDSLCDVLKRALQKPQCEALVYQSLFYTRKMSSHISQSGMIGQFVQELKDSSEALSILMSVITDSVSGRKSKYLDEYSQADLEPLPPAMSDDLSALLNSPGDCEITVGNRVFAGHKCILASRSQYFRESLMTSDRVELPEQDVSDKATSSVMHFTYLGEVPEMNWKVALDFLKIMGEYSLENGKLIMAGTTEAREKCESMIRKQWSADSIVEILTMYDNLGISMDEPVHQAYEMFQHIDKVDVSKMTQRTAIAVMLKFHAPKRTSEAADGEGSPLKTPSRWWAFSRAN